MLQFKHKLYILFFTLFFLFLLISSFDLFQIFQTYKQNVQLQEEATEITKNIYELEYLSSKLNLLGQKHILAEDASQMEKYNKEIESIHKNLDHILNKIALNLDQTAHAKLKNKWETYLTVYNQAIEHSKVQHRDESRKWMEQANSEFEQFLSLYLQPIVRKYYQKYFDLLAEVKANYQHLLLVVSILLLVSFIVFILIFYNLQKVLRESLYLRKKLEFLAFHDELTGLPNRRLFQKKVFEVIEQSPKKFALMYLDMDKFKFVNDHFGHDIGDAVLQQFVEKIKSNLRKDDIFARQGGDEFTVLIKDVDEEEIVKIAERIINSFKEPIRVATNSFQISTSIGIAIYPENGKDYLTLLKNADLALYEAKKKRNTFQFSRWSS